MTTNHPATPAENRARAKEQRQREAFQQSAVKLATDLALLPLVALVLMLAVGAAHGFAPAVPAIGYGTTVLLVIGADALAYVAKKFRK
ncbi:MULTISPECIES: hypothetical protein [unclassified Streptomyces]|uniref:hypothetical protein n=1 Tax=unclassified Streptomyces TaxID=2593676 RepID=UPI00035C129F|nr:MULTISPECIES: hypothetical protein [unclassified Streptomyces]MYY03076.1 hypothetical protein [Streptomyces sp. SID4913]